MKPNNANNEAARPDDRIDAPLSLLGYLPILAVYAAAIVLGLLPFLFVPTYQANRTAVFTTGFIIVIVLTLMALVDWIVEMFADPREP